MTGMKVELEQLWGMNTDQESQITAIEAYHDKFMSLHEQAWNDYKIRRLELK